MKTIVFTSLALLAFAGNSVLCRMALGSSAIDAGSFTWIRLFSGALVLLLILRLSRRDSEVSTHGSWAAGIALFVYALAFSWAYISLNTATGALILFATVQVSMICYELFGGQRLRTLEWLGIAAALSGLVFLLLPGATRPSFDGFVLMTIAGIAWACYTLSGRGSANPLRDTSFNFFRTLPMGFVLLILTLHDAHLSVAGVALAVLSGGLTSGLGYAIWYAALKGLSAIHAGVLQLLVPIIAAFGGVFLAGELLTARLVIASLLILGGIMLLIMSKDNKPRL